jgi:hypothetical protein
LGPAKCEANADAWKEIDVSHIGHDTPVYNDETGTSVEHASSRPSAPTIVCGKITGARSSLTTQNAIVEFTGGSTATAIQPTFGHTFSVPTSSAPVMQPTSGPSVSAPRKRALVFEDETPTPAVPEKKRRSIVFEE